jgi:hypothetical protein
MIGEKEINKLKKTCGFSRNEEPNRKNITILGKGDSWFDYPAGIDLLDYLNNHFNYNVLKSAKAGDKLLNMVYGNDMQFSSNNANVITGLIKRNKVDILLLSGGGNDLAGSQLEVFLEFNTGNYINAENLIDKSQLSIFLNRLKIALYTLIEKVILIKPEIKIIMHNYGYPDVSGKGVLEILGHSDWINGLGPWLKPAFDARNINHDDANIIMRAIMDMYSSILISLQNKFSDNFVFVDLRQIVKMEDWTNELHLNNDAYLKVATEFHKRIQTAIQ